MVEKADTQSRPIQVFLEHIEGPQRDHISDNSKMASQRLHRMVNLTTSLAPSEASVSLVFTGNFVASVQARLEADCDAPDAYNVERGANVAVARTMPRSDGGYDLLFSTDVLFNYEGDTDREVEHTDELLIHLAAHEPQHVWLGWTKTSAEYFQDLGRV